MLTDETGKAVNVGHKFIDHHGTQCEITGIDANGITVSTPGEYIRRRIYRMPEGYAAVLLQGGWIERTAP